MNDILIEVCCGSVEDVLLSEKQGMDRAELNGALFLGGLTPSHATMQLSRERASIPTICMIRPREGGFLYSDDEFEVMKRDLVEARAFGFEGVVFGCLDANGDLDLPRLRELRELAGDCETVFHRAFDVVRDPDVALEQLIEMDFTRVLTSGRLNDALEAKDTFRHLFGKAGDDIEILPCGGLRPHNLGYFLQDMPMVTQVHIGPFTDKPDPSARHNPDIHFGGGLNMRDDRFTGVSEAILDGFRDLRGR